MQTVITDPARLLPGGFWTVEIVVVEPCYCRGCYQPSVVQRVHKVFGAVCACESHDPARHGYVKAEAEIVAPAVTEPVVAASQDAEASPSRESLIASMLAEIIRLSGTDRPDGGKKARLKPPPPTKPPSGAQAGR